MSTAVHGVHELWLGAALDSRWHDEPGAMRGTRAPRRSGRLRAVAGKATSHPLDLRAGSTLRLRPPRLYLMGATTTTCDTHAQCTCKQRHPSHKRHPSRALVWARTISRRPALATQLFASALVSVASPSREDAHRPGGGRAAQRALGPGLLRGAAQAQAQVRARQQQDGARFLCGQIEQFIIVSQ